MTDTALQAALDKKAGKSYAPPLGQGEIGEITQEHVEKCEAWLRPLAQADGFGQLPSLGRSDIKNLLDLGRVTSGVLMTANIGEASVARTMLLVDLANVSKVIRWGMAPQEHENTTETRCRLTARGRRMLQQCCPDLWNQMLYGKKS